MRPVRHNSPLLTARVRACVPESPLSVPRESLWEAVGEAVILAGIFAVFFGLLIVFG